MSKPKHPPQTTDSIAELALWCGVSVRTINTWKQSPDFPVNADGGWSPFDIGAWHALRNVKKPDPELQGPASPALEDYRGERFQIARLERLQREGQLIKREFVRELFSILSSQLRRLGERMNVSSANAASMLEDTIGEVDRLGQEWITKHFAESTNQ